MSRDNGLASFSLDDVVHTLREVQRDWKYSGRFEPMLAFASELTGISEDGLIELVDGEREMDDNPGKVFLPQIVEVFEGVTDGVVYSVEVAPERFVDVKVCEDGTVDYLSKLNGSTRVFSHVYDADGLFIIGGVDFDMEAVLQVVKERVKNPMGVDALLNDAQERAAGLGSCEGLSDIEIGKV